MLSKFIQFFNPQIKEYNKKQNQSVELYTEEKVKATAEIINKLCLIDIEYDNLKDLHLHLINYIDMVGGLSKKRQLKMKEIEYFLNLEATLINLYNEQQEEIDSDVESNEYLTLYSNPLYAKKSVEHYLNLLLSKTVDYIPEGDNVNKLKETLEVMTDYRQKLFRFIDEGYPLWVLPFTEVTHYIPIGLEFLNTYNNLGNNIDEWVDNFRQSKVTELLNDNGFRVFGGWHGLTALPEVKATESKQTEVKDADTDRMTPVLLSKEALAKLNSEVFNHSFMFVHARRYNPRLPEQLQAFNRMVAICIYYCSGGRMVKYGVVLSVLRAVKQACKSSPWFNARHDRKYWFNEKTVENILKYIEAYIKDRSELQASLIALHALDLGIPQDPDANKDYDALRSVDNHYNFLVNTFKYIRYDNPFTEDELNTLIQFSRRYLFPRYESISNKEYSWVYEASLEVALNLRNNGLTDIYYKELNDWFTQRHTVEENKAFYESHYSIYKMTSLWNKADLIERIERNPIDVVNYGQAKEYFDMIINGYRQDTQDPRWFNPNKSEETNKTQNN